MQKIPKTFLIKLLRRIINPVRALHIFPSSVTRGGSGYVTVGAPFIPTSPLRAPGPPSTPNPTPYSKPLPAPLGPQPQHRLRPLSETSAPIPALRPIQLHPTPQLSDSPGSSSGRGEHHPGTALILYSKTPHLSVTTRTLKA